MIGKRQVTLLEISDTHVKLVQGRGGVFSFGDVRPIEQSNDAAIAQLVSRMTAGHDIDQEGLVVVIPRHFAVLKILDLPSHSDEEIRRILGLQLTNHVPYAREDVVFDCQILAKNPGGYARVLLVVVHQDVVQRYMDILQAVKLTPHAMVMSSFGIQSWWQSQCATSLDAEDTMMVISLDNTASEICFLSRKGLYFSRSIQLGSRDLKEEGINRFVEQIGLTEGAYKKDRMGPDIVKIMIVTALPEREALRERLQSFHTVPVECIVPAGKALLPAFLAAHPDVNIVELLGFLDSNRSQLNFMPAQVQNLKRSQKVRGHLIRTVVLFILAGGLALAAWQAGAYHDWTGLQRLEQKVEDLKPQVKQAEKSIRIYELIREDRGAQVIIADVITGLFRLVPKEVTLNTLALTREGLFSVQGVIGEGGSINTFQQALLSSAIFKDVTLEYATQRKRASGVITEFKIVCKLVRPKGGQP